MSEVFKIVATAVLTTFGGVIVFVLGQIVQRLFVEPIQEQRKLLGKAAHAVTYYANIVNKAGFANPATPDDAMKAVRGLAADLRATLATIPVYRVMELLRLAKGRDDVEVISRSLIGFSNTFHSTSDTRDFMRHNSGEELQFRLGLIPRMNKVDLSPRNSTDAV